MKRHPGARGLARSLSRGLTMLELMIAVAVLAVLGAVAIPSLGARMDQQRLIGAAEALVADINEARFEAARQSRSMHVLMQSGPAWCWAVATDSACPCGLGQGCELRHAVPSDHAGVQLLQAQAVLLLPNGQAEAAGGATLQSRRGTQLRVEVMALGRARICTLGSATTRYPAC